jgi:hypothetical protein
MHSDASTVAAYLRALPEDRRKALTRVRALIRKAAPKARESIRHGMPFYELEGPLFAFAAQKHHLSLYVAETRALAQHRASIGKASLGRNCARYRHADAMDFPGIAALLSAAARARSGST